MKNTHKIIVSTIFSILLLLLFLLFIIVEKKGIGQIIDKLGITNDIYEIKIDKELSLDTYIYWHGETVNKLNDNRMLFYHRSKVSDIPPLYGYNGFEIKYGRTTFDEIKFWKLFPYSKYKYYINIKSLDDNMIIEWKIQNWYDEDKHQGIDTIQIIRAENQHE